MDVERGVEEEEESGKEVLLRNTNPIELYRIHVYDTYTHVHQSMYIYIYDYYGISTYLLIDLLLIFPA